MATKLMFGVGSALLLYKYQIYRYVVKCCCLLTKLYGLHSGKSNRRREKRKAEREKERETALIEDTMFCLQCLGEAHALHSDHFFVISIKSKVFFQTWKNSKVYTIN